MNTLWRLSTVNPLKPRLLKILIMQSWSGAVDMVEILHKQFQLLMWRVLQQMPPLPDIPLHLPKLHPHEQFSYLGEHISEQTAHVAKLLPTIPGILPIMLLLPCTTSS